MKLRVALGAAGVALALTTQAGAQAPGGALAAQPGAAPQGAPAKAHATPAAGARDAGPSPKGAPPAAAAPHIGAPRAAKPTAVAAPAGDAAATPKDAAATPSAPVAAAPEAAPPRERAEAIGEYRRTLTQLRDAVRDARVGKSGEEAEAAAKAAREKYTEQLRHARRGLVTAYSGPALSAEQRKRLDERLNQAAKQRAETRDERTGKAREALQKTLGPQADSPAVHNELRRHAWRVARLERLKAIAEAEGKTELVTKAQTLLDKEAELHERRLTTAAKEAPAVAGSAPVKSPAQPAAAAPATIEGAQ